MELSLLHEGRLRRLLIVRHPDGSWTADDRPLPDLDERALDFDVLASAVFNRRPYLCATRCAPADEARDLLMAFVTVPELTVTRARSSATRLSAAGA